MYAIIQTGGKQYRVQKGDVIDVELLAQDESKAVDFHQVLFVHDGKHAHVGSPTVKGSHVKAELLGIGKGPKVVSFKYKRRKDSRITKGHRQKYSRVKITEIVAGKGV